ncbi:MAG: hypothetical protein AMXMBFR84_32900 [Candidatus Hydrogenedentota bacterium]
MLSHVPITRRYFARQAIAAGALAPGLNIVTSAATPNDRIALGVIGLGPRCRYVLPAMMEHADVQCVAVCDVQAERRAAGKKFVDEKYGTADCAEYRDFRELLARDDIDAVLIATGDRWHATASMLAAESGKDVYSEKPCGLTIGLCQDLSATIQRTGRIFQAGTQRRSVANFKAAVGLAHSGKLGRIHTLHASVYRPEFKTEWLPGEPTPNRDVVDWNLWLGPAPWRPYNKQYVDGGWRAHYDFESGARLLDWGAHTIDLCQWAGKSDDTMPIEFVPGETGITATYASGVMLKIHFLETPFEARPGWIQHLGTCPVRFEGDEGWVEVGDSGGIEVSSEALRKELPSLPEAGSGLDVFEHARNFYDCIRSRTPTVANAEVMRRSHIACHAASLSWLLNRTLTLDPVTETFVGDEEANGLRRRPARNWSA